MNGWSSFRALFGLFVDTARTTFRIGGFVVAGVLAVVVAWRLGTQPTEDATQRAADVADVIGISFLAPLASLIFGTAMFGDLADDDTLVYLWLRPTPRYLISAAAHSAALVASLPAVVVSIAAVQIALGSPLGIILATAAATAAATVAATSVFVALGLITKRALVWGIAYVLIVEQFLARGGSGLGSISIRSASMSIIAHFTDSESAVAWFGPWRSMAMLIVVSVVARAVTVWALRHREVA